jgi:hypothetical protein
MMLKYYYKSLVLYDSEPNILSAIVLIKLT